MSKQYSGKNEDHAKDIVIGAIRSRHTMNFLREGQLGHFKGQKGVWFGTDPDGVNVEWRFITQESHKNMDSGTELWKKIGDSIEKSDPEKNTVLGYFNEETGEIYGANYTWEGKPLFL